MPECARCAPEASSSIRTPAPPPDRRTASGTCALSPAYTKSQCVSMVVPPPMAAPCTAATSGLSKSTSAFIQPGLRRFTRPRRVLEKVLDIVAGAERIAGAVPEHDTYRSSVAASLRISARPIHARRHRVLLRRPIQFDPKDASERSVMISSIGQPPICLGRLRCAILLAFGMTPLARKPSMPSASKPSCRRISSLCSPSPGARCAGTLADAVHLDRTADGRGQLAAGALRAGRRSRSRAIADR